MKLPHNEEAERIVLSVVMNEGPSALLKALDYKVTEAWFYNAFAKVIWKQVNEAHIRGIGLEPHIICAELKKTDPDLKRCGGLANFSDISGASPTPLAFVYSLDALRDLYQARELAVVASETTQMALAGKPQVDEFVAKISKVLAIRNQTATQVSLKDAASQVMADLAKLLSGEAEQTGMTWPWPDMTKELGAATGGELIVIAARPGVGKSSMARDICRHFASRYGDTLLFSREMPVKKVCKGLAGMMSGVSVRAIESRQANPYQIKAFENALKDIETNLSKKLHIFDSDRNPSQIAARIEACKAFMSVKAVVIDYLQLYVPPHGKGETRDIAIGQTTLAFKDLAVSMGIPVILLAQVSREVERENRIPRLSDLRESGNIEQDADRVIFIHLPTENSEGGTQSLNDQTVQNLEVEIVQAKGRDNGCASIRMVFNRPTTKFQQIAR
jgi:replicative DNA helicase